MYLVFDIGGTFIKYALMQADGSFIEKGKQPTPQTSFSQFQDALFSIIDRYDSSSIEGVAISCPGTIDVENGIIYNGGWLTYLHEAPLARIIEEKYGFPVSIENDAKCAALAELWKGSIEGCKNAIVLVLGSGVGGGLIIDGKLHRGAHLSAGEVSFCMTSYNPETKQGTLFGSAGSAVRMVQNIAAAKGVPEASGQQIFEWINEGDQQANAIFNEYCAQIAAQILNLQYIIDPEKVAIGGGISAQPIVKERIEAALQEIIAGDPMHTAAQPQIVTCQFQNDANLFGAMYNFFTLHGEKELAVSY